MNCWILKLDNVERYKNTTYIGKPVGTLTELTEVYKKAKFEVHILCNSLMEL